MPLLGSIFHFLAPVFHMFYENCSQSDSKMTPELYKIIKICWKNKYILKMNQSDFKVTFLYRKWPKVNPKCAKSPQSDPKTLPAQHAFCTVGMLQASLTSKIRRKNVCLLLMDSFGSDTRRHDRHYECHSTSICHLWGPFSLSGVCLPHVF